jgi:lipopolysaccharide export system protein LptA
VRKYILFLLIILTAYSVKAQKVTRIELIKSDSFIGLKRNGENTNKVINPIFRQDNATLTCDSAYFYLEKNNFEAFGHVHINQADTVNIYSDHLNYDGNTKLAILKNNVRLTDNQAILTTNDLDYDLGTKIGRYYNGGKIINDQNILTSQNGYYFTGTKDAYFRYKVNVKSPEVLIKSDTLKYNTLSKIAYFFGPTHIYGKTDTLYTENGQYNTSNDQAAFGKKNLYTQNSKSLKGDSLFYDGKLGYGRAKKNIVFIDTAQKVELRGDLGLYKKKDESIEVTKNAYLIFVTEKDSVKKDSIWMTADTLKSRVLMKMELYEIKDSINAAIAKTDTSGLLLNNLKDPLNRDTVFADSLKLKPVNINKKPKPSEVKEKIKKGLKNRPEAIPIRLIVRAPYYYSSFNKVKIPKPYSVGIGIVVPNRKKSTSSFVQDIPPEATDTARIRVVSAYRRVKIFKSDLQAKADSAFFSYGDSTLRIYQKPMVWAEASQLSADTMYIQMKNKKVDNMDLIRNSIVVNTGKDSLKYNQIAGKMMKGHFRNDKLDVIFVNGNAESIYFPTDSSSENGMMRSIASRMRINFSNDSLVQITFIRKPEHNYYPFDKITEELKTLPNFNWKPKERPKSKEDIIPSLKRRVISAKELPEKKVEKKLRAVDKTKKIKFVMTPTKKE